MARQKEVKALQFGRWFVATRNKISYSFLANKTEQTTGGGPMKVISPLQQDGESTVARTVLDEDDDAEKDHKITLFEMSGWGIGK